MINKAIEIKNAVYNMNIMRDDIDVYNRITISVGCDMINLKEIEEISDIYSLVDKQLYSAKEKMRNCVSFRGIKCEERKK